MRSTFHAIETAKRSLFTQQAALQTTGHNVANANTTGYSRQVVNMTASRPMEAIGMSSSTTPGQLGTGVEFSSITRIREGFLDSQFRNENKTHGSWSIQADTLQKLETIVNEPSDTGLRAVLDNFWKSWHDLSENPEDITARKLVRETAKAVTDAFNQTARQLDELSADITENIGVKANQINTALETISSLNLQIRKIEGLGDNANDLRDQRDLLMDELSKVVNVTSVETNDGNYQVMMGGAVLVDNGEYTPVTAEGLLASFAGGDLNGGEVHGMIISRDQYVANYQQQLNTLVNGLANGDITVTIPAGSVLPDGITLNNITYSGTARTLTSPLTVTVKGLNGLHQLGYTMMDPPQAGGTFFASKDGGPITAGNVTLNADILADAGYIASSMRTSGTPEAVVKGNKDLAMLISQFSEMKIDFSSVATGAATAQGSVNDFFRSIVGQLGVEAEEANRQTTNAKIVVDQVDARRQSVSGVSLDEEMSNMVKFQHAYNAAARFMTTIDETLDRIINGMGTVGR
ncbi:flagellar hook-associated protein FlgK [Cohnella sp. CIP 111063]|uniref:flagellar hook-associated protein FlgK n=1 Tax=unclassified Cohnella TaxID=2636738 RepID=UPI000B8C67DE|nr:MULTISPECIES: flagellar hook-associated protein FlgK [unclassified Cohnella]OXS55988.1 flagellar hook-associated protein FlgK [Cohnella sp. CIP 111063]